VGTVPPEELDDECELWLLPPPHRPAAGTNFAKCDL
jgi:hypothetical protein